MCTMHNMWSMHGSKGWLIISEKKEQFATVLTALKLSHNAMQSIWPCTCSVTDAISMAFFLAHFLHFWLSDQILSQNVFSHIGLKLQNYIFCVFRFFSLQKLLLWYSNIVSANSKATCNFQYAYCVCNMWSMHGSNGWLTVLK